MIMMSDELADAIFDPRGENQFYELKLAQRPSLQALRDGKVLFFDNTKLDFCHYREIFTRLEAVLNENGIHHIEHVRQSVRGTMTEQIRALADNLAQRQVQAAVVALADMGTSVMTTILAIELEKRGIATLLIASPPETIWPNTWRITGRGSCAFAVSISIRQAPSAISAVRLTPSAPACWRRLLVPAIRRPPLHFIRRWTAIGTCQGRK